MEFIITVDTEAGNQKNRDDSLSLRNIEQIPRFQKLCDKYGFKPWYLVTYEVANDKRSIEILKPILDSGRCEIGAHLHPWTTPPYNEYDQEWELKHHRYITELSKQEFRDKLGVLTDKIKESFGVRPTKFRAGRWSITGWNLKVLEEFDYEIDCSVTPMVTWQSMKGDPEGKGGSDYRLAPVRPYHPGYEDINTKGESKILEMPMTILPIGMIQNVDSFFIKIYNQLPESFFKKVFNKIFIKRTWLRVFSNSDIESFKMMVQVAKRNKFMYLMFMLHSSELLVGESQINKSSEDEKSFWRKMELLFREIRKIQNEKGI